MIEQQAKRLGPIARWSCHEGGMWADATGAWCNYHDSMGLITLLRGKLQDAVALFQEASELLESSEKLLSLQKQEIAELRAMNEILRTAGK